MSLLDSPDPPDPSDPTPQPPSSWPAGFDPLHADLDAWAGLPAAVRDRARCAVLAEMGRLAVLDAAIIHRSETAGLYVDDGYRSEKQHVRAVGNTSGATAGYALKLSRMFPQLEHVADAYATGAIGADQVRQFADLWSNPRCRPQLPAWEQYLLGWAQRLVYDDFVQVCDRWRLAADPDGARREHREAHAQRHAQLDTVGAWFRLIMEGDNVTGDMMRNVLEAHVEAEYLTDVANRALQHGDDADGHPLPRTQLQRMADAITAIFMKAADHGDTTSREPLVVIHTTPHVLEKALREFLDSGGAGCPAVPFEATPENAASLRMRLCETSRGTPVSLRDLAVAAIVGSVQRIVIDPHSGHAINFGRKQRLFTGPARQAVLYVGGRCMGPGCASQHAGIQCDHLKPWEWFGLTDQDNAGPLCGTCNRAKHAHRITVRRDQDGWHWYRPDGTEIAPRGGRPDAP